MWLHSLKRLMQKWFLFLHFEFVHMLHEKQLTDLTCASVWALEVSLMRFSAERRCNVILIDNFVTCKWKLKMKKNNVIDLNFKWLDVWLDVLNTGYFFFMKIQPKNKLCIHGASWIRFINVERWEDWGGTLDGIYQSFWWVQSETELNTNTETHCHRQRSS